MAKVLIDLGTEGQPQSGDTLPEGGAKINQHINDVYAAFSPRIQPDENKTLHATGVYQSISYDDAPLNELSGFREYTASPGEMIVIDMDDAVSIFLPSGVYQGCHIKIFRPTSVSSAPIRVYGADGMVQNQEYVEIVSGIQYQFISRLDFAKDGAWSQRIIDGSGVSTPTKENSITLSSNAGVVVVDCSLGNYFNLQLNENVTQFNFTNIPNNSESSTKIIRIDQELYSSYTVNLTSLGGHWSNNTYSDEIVNNAGLLAVTYIAGNSFNTWINGWFELV